MFIYSTEAGAFVSALSNTAPVVHLAAGSPHQLSASIVCLNQHHPWTKTLPLTGSLGSVQFEIDRLSVLM